MSWRSLGHCGGTSPRPELDPCDHTLWGRIYQYGPSAERERERDRGEDKILLYFEEFDCFGKNWTHGCLLPAS